MKQGEKEGAKSKSKGSSNSKRNGGRNRKGNGGRQSKGKIQVMNKASKASKCGSAKNNSWKRRARKAQTSWRYRVDLLQEMREGGEERATEGEQQRNEEKEEILRLLEEWQQRETSPIF